MARTIEEHQAAFTQAGADGYKQAEAFGHVVGDLIEARTSITETVSLLVATVAKYETVIRETNESFDRAMALLRDQEAGMKRAMVLANEALSLRDLDVPPFEACTIREPDSLSGAYRCFAAGLSPTVGKGGSAAEAFADFVTKFAASGRAKP